jgi:hypothetical protein
MFSGEQIRSNEFSSTVLETARRINQSIRLTRGTQLPMICRDCAAFEALMRACLLKNFVRPSIQRTNPIIRKKKQNYRFAIDLAHISIAKLGWLRVAPTHKANAQGRTLCA